jgi:hypothetical protein
MSHACKFLSLYLGSNGPGACYEEEVRESPPILRPSRPTCAAGPIPVPGAAEPLTRLDPLQSSEDLPQSVPPSS